MTTEFTEDEFINKYGQEEYEKLANDVFCNMIKLPEYKNNKPMVYAVLSFELSTNEHVMVTADIKKMGVANDFGMHRIVSDQYITDELMDEYRIKKFK